MASFLRDKKQFNEPLVDLQLVQTDDNEYEIPTWYKEYLEDFGVQTGNFNAYEFVSTFDLHQRLTEEYLGRENSENLSKEVDN